MRSDGFSFPGLAPRSGRVYQGCCTDNLLPVLLDDSGPRFLCRARPSGSKRVSPRPCKPMVRPAAYRGTV